MSLPATPLPRPICPESPLSPPIPVLLPLRLRPVKSSYVGLLVSESSALLLPGIYVYIKILSLFFLLMMYCLFFFPYYIYVSMHVVIVCFWTAKLSLLLRRLLVKLLLSPSAMGCSVLRMICKRYGISLLLVLMLFSASEFGVYGLPLC